MSAKVCVIDDGRPGHVNQTLGALRMLQVSDMEISTAKIMVRRKYLKRPILLGLTLFSRLPQRLLTLAYAGYYGQRPPQLAPATLIMSTGGDTLIANIVLAKINSLNNVFIGKRKRVTDANVKLLVTSSGPSTPGKIITIPFAPVYPALGPRLNIDREPGVHICAVLVGGDSQEYRYSETDFHKLAEALNQLCEEQKMRILITTSRRTGSTGENILRSTLQNEYVIDATWYGDNPRTTSAAYCRESDLIMVTEDSGTMLTEALILGKPLIALSLGQFTANPIHERLLDRLSAQGMYRYPISDIGHLKIDNLIAARAPKENEELIYSIRQLLNTNA